MSYTPKDLGDPAAIAGASQRTAITLPNLQPGGLVLAINDSPYAIDLYLSSTPARIPPRSIREIRLSANTPGQVYWSVAYNGGSAGASNVLIEVYDPGSCPNPFERAAGAIASASGGSQYPLTLASLNVHQFFPPASGTGYAGSETDMLYTVTAAGVYRCSLSFDLLVQNGVGWDIYWQHYSKATNVQYGYLVAAYDTTWRNNANPPIELMYHTNTYPYVDSVPEIFQTVPVLFGCQPNDTISLYVNCPQTAALSQAPGIALTAALERVS